MRSELTNGILSSQNQRMVVVEIPVIPLPRQPKSLGRMIKEINHKSEKKKLIYRSCVRFNADIEMLSQNW